MHKGPLKLHIGAFDKAVDGWLNTDITPHLFVARIPLAARALRLAGKLDELRWRQHREGVFRRLCYMDLTRPLPLPDASVEAVFSSHVLEHLFADEVQRLVHELRRVLAPGGICRVIVPDLEKIVSRYDRHDPAAFLNEIFEVGERRKIATAHHTGFTGPSLIKLFTSAGFTDASIEGYRQGRCPDIDLLDNRPDSLFFEAVR